MNDQPIAEEPIITSRETSDVPEEPETSAAVSVVVDHNRIQVDTVLATRGSLRLIQPGQPLRRYRQGV